jgi:hypothetical protein
MKRFKVLFLAAMAVFALSAMLVASASAAPEALNAEGKGTAATFSGNSEKETKLAVLKSPLGLEVKCAKTKSSGTIEAGGKLGTVKLTFETCSTSLGGECTGLGDAAKTILSNGTIHLAANRGLTAGLMLFLIEHTHFSCTVLGVTKLFLVLGELLCAVTPINTLTATLTITCSRGAEPGDPGVTEYENDKGENATLTNALKTSEGDVTTEEMSSELGEGAVTVTPQVKLDI